jgi:D-arginine dehydrogenase
VVLNAEAGKIRRADGIWRVETRAESFEAPVLINAAGAWGDEVARMAGVAPLGLTPMRRTVATFDPPEGVDPAPWPMVVGASENLYFKPDAGRILVSPADETGSVPCDAQPEEIDVAVAMDRLQQVTSLAPRRIAHKWAGLRTFAPDRMPVAGFDGQAEGFFWLVGQGGTGIQMAPALARCASALLTGDAPPQDLAGHGVEAVELSPQRAALCRASTGGRPS